MGRRHRSSSFGTSAPSRSSSFSSPQQPTSSAGAGTLGTNSKNPKSIDIPACNKILNFLLHSEDADGRTFLHRAVHASCLPPSNLSKSTAGAEAQQFLEYQQMDGLYLLNSLIQRAKEFDKASAASASTASNPKGNAAPKPSTLSSGNHLRKMMLSKDTESGYTPLHAAILRRDLLSLLLLLKHISTESEDVNAFSQDYSLFGSQPRSSQMQSVQQMQHPLRLLDGDLGDEESFSIMNDLADVLDHENLTPLQLLGATSAGALERCREELQWKSLRKFWKRESARVQSENGDSNSNVAGSAAESSRSEEEFETNPRRYRQRMVSFGDDRDYGSLQYEIEDAPDRSRERRSRSGSFNVEGYHNDEEDEEVANENRGNNGANDLEPLGNVDFSVLNESNNEEGRNGNGTSVAGGRQRANSILSETNAAESGSAEHGCEVFTFGRADHCALGVPQFSTAGRRERRGEDNFSAGSKAVAAKASDGSSAPSKSYKPRRVEAFALGEMRRGWGDSNVLLSSEESAVDSPAVAVAAASHHTLVVTKGGRLFSFGLGKGGRLGTGDENHRPLPVRIGGPLTKRIVASIAAAENHSLCSTSDGDVFAWGSNRFGQLAQSQDQNGSRLSPRRVEDLKHDFVVAVSAADRHSVALTRLGEVYCWGDNRSGQLGTRTLVQNSGASSSVLSGPGSSSSPPSASNSRCCHRPQRVEGLWSGQPRRRAIAIAAAEFSTLVLTMPPTISDGESSLAALPVNVVYGWGHGNGVPMRVYFPNNESSNSLSGQLSGPSHNGSAPYIRSTCINPTAIACAKYHSVAITKDGRVFTWGLHSESLGIERDVALKSDSSEWSTPSKGKSNQHASTISSPQLVSAMLPENGGGRAVSVSASESHTAVVTADGHLFTWGSSYGSDVLGHKGVKWQPSPRKVKRVHRAVGVSSAKEHTALLIGTTFPPLPQIQPLSDEIFYPASDLKSSYENSSLISLQDTAAREIARNVDLFNVIPVANIAHRLNSKPLLCYCEKFVQMNLDGVLSVGNVMDLESFLMSRGIFSLTSDCLSLGDGVFHPLFHHIAHSQHWMEDNQLIAKFCTPLIQAKRIKKVRKSEQQLSEKEVAAVNKLAKPLNEKEISTPSKKSVEGIEKAVVTPTVPAKVLNGEKQIKVVSLPFEASKYQCTVCGVCCPDSDSYTLHVNGRKHRNRLNHAKAQEEKKVAENMMAMKQLQLMENDGGDVIFQNQMMKGKNAVSTKVSKCANEANNVMPKMAWGSPEAIPVKPKYTQDEKRGRASSFREILNEEQKRASNSPQPKAVASGKMAERKLNPQQLSIGSPSPQKHSMRFAKTPPLASMKESRCATGASASPSVTLSLSSFLPTNDRKVAKTNIIDPITHKWGSKPEDTKVPNQGPDSKAISFFDIQKEEEAMRNKEDHMCKIGGNKWYIQQRQRAASIGDIQEQQKKDADFLLLVEEQRKIEEEIMLENQRKQQQEKEKKLKKRNGRKNQGNTPRKNKSSGNPKQAAAVAKTPVR